MRVPSRSVSVRACALALILLGVLGTDALAANRSPRIHYLDVTAAPVGAYIGVYGGDLGSSGTLKFGSVSATEIVQWTATRILAKVPSGAGSPVVVQNSVGSSNGEPLSIQSGQIRWVAITGSDTNPGAQSSPYRTINYAARQANPGDVILVRAGTYTEQTGSRSLYLTSSEAGTASQPVTIRSYPGETVTLNATGTNADTVRIEGSYINFVGFRVTGASGNGWIANGSVQGIRLVDCDLYGNNVTAPASSGSGVKINEGTSNVKILGNRIYNNGSSNLDHGMYIKGDDMEIAWNDVYGNTAYGIQAYSSSALPWARAKIHSNRCHNNVKAGILVGSGSSDADVYNNVSWANGKTGIEMAYGPTRTRIFNNTCHANGGGSGHQILVSDSATTTLRNNVLTDPSGHMLRVESTATGVDSDYNQFGSGGSRTFNWLGTEYDFAGYQTASGKDGHAAVGDPLYVGAATTDFHLQSGSPAKDSALASAAPASDCDRFARPWGSGFDKGAYEYGDSGSPPDPTPPAAVTGLVRTDRH